MNVKRIVEVLNDCAGVLDSNQKALRDSEVVDIWFLVALRPDKVRKHEHEMIELLKTWPSESNGRPVPSLGQEIDYIITTSILGDQQHALMLFAFGKLLGWWRVMEPHGILGLEKDDRFAQKMVRDGLITISGYTPT